MNDAILIKNALIVNERREYTGYVLTAGDRIAQVGEGDYRGPEPVRSIDAAGCLLIPGVIDDQVHFREPGLTHKGDIHSESTAAVTGGVTSCMEMPNTQPPAATIDLLNEKFARAAETSVANYSFYLGATNDNLDEIKKIDPRRVCGLKVFMGSSTGNMLVDRNESLAAIFSESPVLVATHCEDEATIRRNLAHFKALYGEKIAPNVHPLIRSEEACYLSTVHAVELATKYGADLHVLHLSTVRELGLFGDGPLSGKKITNEVCVHHLWFTERDYRRKGNLIKWNPAIKTAADREGLVAGIGRGRVDVVATDHAPHTKEEKAQPYLSCPSGGPSVQHSLTVMLELFKRGELALADVVEKMCHAPAIRFKVKDRGFLREGAYADLVLVDLYSAWEVSTENILCKCGWSPFDGERFSTHVTHTVINGRIVYENGVVDTSFRGMPLAFDR
ncbi:MAG: dihydroorotase [Rikenellaceae bacterium]|jgi:dihydroorotase|nr:dihydroorotase [Rikenellaceae bacterium]